MKIFLEERPGYYVGDYPVVIIVYREDDRDMAEKLASQIRDLEEEK